MPKTARKPKSTTRPNRAIKAVLALEEIGPTAKEEAIQLLGDYLNERGQDDLSERTLGVEQKFHIKQRAEGGSNYIVGIVDRLSVPADDPNTLIITDYKTKKSSKWLREEEWEREQRRGIQAVTYAWWKWKPSTRVIIRMLGVVRSTGTPLWPYEFEYTDGDIQRVAAAYLTRGSQIRSLRKLSARTPTLAWGYTGPWCHSWNRDCEFLAYCSNQSDPHDIKWVGSKKDYTAFGVNQGTNDVVMSPSSYALFTGCPEKYRLQMELGQDQGSMETGYDAEVGTGFHAGIAEFFRD
jgi:hypothetical protein